ncbi:MAG: hypothetical protein EOM70_09225, partial [Clostridia bacterium]|nr:hypothetical protein [Clostridia bacterium]
MGEGTSNGGYRIRQTLLTTQAIQDRISALGQQISHDYTGQELVLVGVLKGSLYFMADLSRAIDLPLTLDFMTIGTIPNTTNQTGIVRITKDLDVDITGKQV